MPELPEVEVVRAGLERHVARRHDHLRRGAPPPPGTPRPARPDDFAAALTGRRFTAARRRGKYFWLPLDNGDALLGHLGMSGQMLVQPPGAPDERHLRVRFVARPAASSSCGSSTSGCSAGCRSPTAAPTCRRRSPTSPATRSTRSSTTTSSYAACAGARPGIKRLLLDQGLISGVGNIYADEALWRARVHGDRPGDRLTAAQVRELLGQAREVMPEALGQGGTSFDALYVNVNGESGYFDRSLHAYGREGEPCARCGTPDPAGRVHEPVVVLLPDLPARRRGADRTSPDRFDRLDAAARLT